MKMNPARARISFFRLLLPVFLLIAALFSPRPALAALAVTGVSPDFISNQSPVTLTVYGNDFVQGAYVALSNGQSLSTVYGDAFTLYADLPEGLEPGVYNLTVVNGDGSMASLLNALTVTDVGIDPIYSTEPTLTQAPPLESTLPANRPLIVVHSYGANTETVTPGSEFSLTVRLKNIGQLTARNLVASFTPGEFIPRDSGGVLAVTHIEPEDTHRFVQPLVATYDLVSKYNGTVVMQVNYTDENGASYSETFNLTLPVKQYYGAYSTATPTPTGTPPARPQFIISNYITDMGMLKPGTRFSLGIQAKNVGNGTARRVTMILGGGSASSGTDNGTPVPGGVSGGSGEFGKFAPVDASNVQYLGDVDMAGEITAQAALIVNSTTEPGAYPMKISFTYTTDTGTTYTDDQVITLLVYSPPSVEVNFYQGPVVLMAGQPGPLPLQVVNLGRKQAVLGNMKVTGEGGQFSQNSTLIGPLDPGGYFPLDAMVVPDAPGTLNLVISIDYTDDFNQAQVITRTLAVEVQAAPPLVEPGLEGTPGAGQQGVGPGGDGGAFPGGAPGLAGPETFWQKAWRFMRGLLGLDSGQNPGTPGEAPPGETPPVEKPVPAPSGGKG